MPGARLRTFRLGDRSELLVEQLLAGFAFTTRVPRQEDVGADFFCSLIHQQEHLLKAGPFFTVQAKSSTEAVVYEKPHEVEWITNQENPFLLCVADRKALAMDVYSTWNLLCGVLNGWRGQRKPSRIVLLPGVDSDGWPGVEDKDDGSQEIRLGKPIAHVTDADLFDDTRLNLIASVIGEWVALDRTNIVNRHAHMYWVVGPLTYQTDQLPWAAGQGGVAFYYHPANLQNAAINLGRVATALTFVLLHPQTQLDLTKPPWLARMAALDELLRSHWELFDEPARQFMTAQGMKPSSQAPKTQANLE